MTERYSRILGLGMKVPGRVVTNQDLTQWMDTSHEWIVERTGIEERRWIDEGESGAGLATEASSQALDSAGVKPGDIDLIVYATLSPDCEFPGTGVFLQRNLGIPPIPVIDIRQQCTGFVYGLAVADSFIRCGTARTALIVGSEVQSTGLDVSTRGRQVSSLFGDGAGAAVAGPSDDPSRRILSSHLYADGTDAEILWTARPSWKQRPRITSQDLEKGLHYPVMDGKKVFKQAVTRMPQMVKEALDANGYTLADLDLLIPHQANLRINELVAKSLNLPPEKVFNNIRKYGNTTSASIPICMKEAADEGRINPGDLVCLVAFGAGLTWGATLLRY
jgi:3-oxoacyl-[acyl-carrier-protein] synthase-3